MSALGCHLGLEVPCGLGVLGRCPGGGTWSEWGGAL